MKYKLLGRSGLRVSEICLGAMTFGTEYGWGAPKEECKKIFDTFLKAGGNFIDTANRYTEGTSEKFVGEFIAGTRDEIVLATKYTLFTRPGDPNSAGNHRKNMIQSLEASLRRLNTEYIDLYWVHAWDFMTPVDEIMRALDDMVRAGKILYIGISDTPAWIVSRANTMADLMGWTPFTALQVEYSLIERTAERDLLPMARALDLAVTPWGPLGGGLLTGKYRQKTSEPKRMQDGKSRRLSERNFNITDEVIKIAESIGHSPAQIALNWLRQQPGIIIPIVGARTAGQITDNLGCLDFELSTEHMSRLDEISKIDLGFPHEFLTRDYIRHLVFGGTYESIINHRKY
jgi:aryl-alcohol dehydrogenase-like predicted oxidoreductase